MAKGKQAKSGPAAADGETIAGYFRKIFAKKPSLLKGRSNDELLKQWLADHPGEKEVPRSVKNSLQNIKSVLRSKGRKKTKASEAMQAAASPSMPPVKKAPLSKLEGLEEHIDECLSLAKSIDREQLRDVIHHLRRARNLVVWQTGE
jgi:hypothetical protein